MNKYEKIKKYCLLSGLDEPFDLYSLKTNISNTFRNLNGTELQNRVIKIIRYFLEIKLFEIGEFTENFETFEKYNSSLDNILSKIKSILEKDLKYSLTCWICLTPEGIKEAKLYLLKIIHTKEKILTRSQITITCITKIIKEDFNINDPEEIKEELVNIISNLINNRFIILQILTNKYLININGIIENYKQIQTILEEIEKNPEIENYIKILNTNPTDVLVNKWKQCGGKLVDEWYDLIDNR